jgi:hypothetical protein
MDAFSTTLVYRRGRRKVSTDGFFVKRSYTAEPLAQFLRDHYKNGPLCRTSATSTRINEPYTIAGPEGSLIDSRIVPFFSTLRRCRQVLAGQTIILLDFDANSIHICIEICNAFD